MKKESQVIFDKNVIEFVTVAAEFCAFLERAESMKRSTFVDTTLKILPLLYLKASMLPKCEMIGDESPETYVTDEIYETMNDSLAICQENFGLLWGQKLVNTMRALHDVKYSPKARGEDEEEEEYEPENNEDCHCEDDDCHCHDHGCHCHDDE